MNQQPLPPYNFPVGTMIEIDGRPHRPPVEHIPGRLTITDGHTGQPFLIPDGNGGTVLPSPADYDRLSIDGRVEVKFPPSMIAAEALMTRAEWDMSDLEEFDPRIRWVIKQVEVLDEAGVPNGIKAMKKALETLWTQELIDEFGAHAPPATIKHWRSKGKPGARDHRLLVRMAVHIPKLVWSRDEEDFMAFADAFDQALVDARILAYKAGLGTPAIAQLLLESAGGLIGRFARIIETAILGITREGVDTITRADLRDAVSDWAIGNGHINYNPFVKSKGDMTTATGENAKDDDGAGDDIDQTHDDAARTEDGSDNDGGQPFAREKAA